MFAYYQQRETKFSGSLWNVRAMQLWNDWNTAVYEWAMRHISVENNDAVDYMWMRSEDLLPGSPQRYECLTALAHFVQSTLTPQQLCALSAQNARDYGKSMVHNELAPPNPKEPSVGERWKQQMHNKVRKHHPRRQLREVNGKAPNIVASDFIDDFVTWKGLVEMNLSKTMEETKKFVLEGLIGHGADLIKQWHLNDFDSQAEELKEQVTLKGIFDLNQRLRVQLQEARLFAHNKEQEGRPGDPDVKNRYGKWQGVLSNNTELADYFYQEGSHGLSTFGYHPEKNIQYLSEDSLQRIGRCVDGRLEQINETNAQGVD
ncbi:MAG: hypothetical protein SGILL_010172 [Bacillariaceae sp.]